MMEQIINCRRCGKVIHSNGYSDLCIECGEKDERDFARIRDYLREHQRANIYEVSTNVDIAVSQIKKYLREGRLEIVEKINPFLDCEICGKPIQSGKYCDECFKQAHHDFKVVYADNRHRGTTAKTNNQSIGFRKVSNR